MYRFLATEAGVYLPHYDVVTIWHLKELAAGKRRIILAKNIKHLFVPQFEHLTVEKMLIFASGFPDVMIALPAVEHERLKLHRQYIINVIYTLVPEPFHSWVDQIMDTRTSEIKQDKDMLIEMDPAVLEAF